MTPLMLLLLAASPQSQPETAQKPDAKVCRSYPVTGNRAKREHICRTRAQWRAADDEQRRVGTEAIERSRRATVNNY